MNTYCDYLSFKSMLLNVLDSKDTIDHFLIYNNLLNEHKTGRTVVWKRYYDIIFQDKEFVNAILSLSSEMHPESSLHDRLRVIRIGIETQTLNCIICGNKTRFNDRSMSTVCSKKCQLELVNCRSHTPGASLKREETKRQKRISPIQKKITTRKRIQSRNPEDKLETTYRKWPSKKYKNPTTKPIRKNTYSYKFYDYELENGSYWRCQGFERFALDKLRSLGYILETEIEKKSVRYHWDGKYKPHRPDIFIPKENKFIEVKGEWTFTVDKEKNIAKQKGAKGQGYKYEIWIFDKDKNLLEILS